MDLDCVTLWRQAINFIHYTQRQYNHKDKNFQVNKYMCCSMFLTPWPQGSFLYTNNNVPVTRGNFYLHKYFVTIIWTLAEISKWQLLPSTPAFPQWQLNARRIIIASKRPSNIVMEGCMYVHPPHSASRHPFLGLASGLIAQCLGVNYIHCTFILNLKKKKIIEEYLQCTDFLFFLCFY